MNNINEEVLKNRELAELIFNKEYGNAIDKAIDLTLAEVGKVIDDWWIEFKENVLDNGQDEEEFLKQLKKEIGI